VGSRVCLFVFFLGSPVAKFRQNTKNQNKKGILYHNIFSEKKSSNLENYFLFFSFLFSENSSPHLDCAHCFFFFFFLVWFAKKEKLKIKNLKKEVRFKIKISEGFQLPEVRRKNKEENFPDLYIWFSLYRKNYRRMMDICNLFIYNNIQIFG
jgi:hypothetical protein